jgi:hypothetical protein
MKSSFPSSDGVIPWPKLIAKQPWPAAGRGVRKFDSPEIAALAAGATPAVSSG